MQITLRRAMTLQTAIHDAMKSLAVTPRIEISLFADFDTQIAAEQARLEDGIQRKNRLVEALFELRRKVAVSNAAAGITDLLASQAENGMRIEMLTQFADAKPFEGLEVTLKRAERLASREEPASPYGHRAGPVESLVVNLLTEEGVEASRVELLALKKYRTKLKDQLAELNAVTRLDLSAATVETLTAEHLL